MISAPAKASQGGGSVWPLLLVCGLHRIKLGLPVGSSPHRATPAPKLQGLAELAILSALESLKEVLVKND